MTRLRRQQYVLWVSTRRDTRGGIGSYVRTIETTPLWSEWSIQLLSTHRDGTAGAKVLEFSRSLVSLVGRLAVCPPAAVHVHMASNGSFARKAVVVALCRTRRVPVVLHIHGGGFADFYQNAAAPVRALVRATLSAAAVLVALGDTWAARLRDIAPRARIEVVPNAARVTDQLPSRDKESPVQMVFLGDVREQKGVFELLQAWARLDVGTGARLVVAGTGEVERARGFARHLGISTSVDVVGWLAPAAVPALLAASDVLVLPSWIEGQPMAVLEAMGQGLCVVATDVGGIPDLIDDERSGLLVRPSDVEALTKALSRVLADPTLRAALGSAAFDRARREFATDVVWRQIDALYREVLARGGNCG